MGYIKFDKPIQTQNGGVGEEGCKMKGFTAALLVLLLSFLCPARAATYYVPDDFPTIQAAIEAASNGDEIIVRPGTYYENINFLGKAIYLHSEQGPDVTIIDGQQNGSVVTFNSGEGEDSIIEGFTITNGSGTSVLLLRSEYHYCGGGILCMDNTSPKIVANVITGNIAEFGGGIHCQYSTPKILANIISENTSYNGEFGDGAGICCWYANPYIANNILTKNTAECTGGAIYGHYSSPIIQNNVIYGNIAYGVGPYSWDFGGGGLGFFSGGNPVVINCIIAENYSGEYGGGIGCLSYGDATILYSDFWANTPEDFYNCSPGEGCIFEDPLFADPENNDYHLCSNSPCRDAGDPSILDPDGTRSDIGAYGGPDAQDFWYAMLHCPVTFYTDWHLLSVSLVDFPGGPEASNVFSDLIEGGNNIENFLYAYSPSFGYLVYPVDFTDVAPGIGYWLFITNPGDYIISGQELREDFSIPLSSGWNLIGHPFIEPVLLSSCMVKHPREGLVSIEEAVNNGWLALPFYKYIPTLGYRIVSYIGPYDDDHLRPWTGYWVFATVDNLKLIIPYPTE